MISPSVAVTAQEKKLQALCALSNVSPHVSVKQLVSTVSSAPDPETAIQAVLGAISMPSEVLERKWRSTIEAIWSSHHPHVPLLPSLNLSSREVRHGYILQDAEAYLETLLCEPAQLVEEQSDLLVDAPDVMRLAAAMPSLALTKDKLPVENEWSYHSLRRLRATLQALRLVRPMKGRLVVVRSRYERFLDFPATQQFYLLWHADTYHVDWSEFSGMWGKYTRVMQDYLPLLWDLGTHLAAGQRVDRGAWCGEMLESFAPLWEEEGLLEVGHGQAAILPIVQQHALPTILERFIVRDLFQRHGLATLSEEFGELSVFTWTRVGEALLKAELTQELPCGLELLNGNTAAMPDINSKFIS